MPPELQLAGPEVEQRPGHVGRIAASAQQLQALLEQRTGSFEGAAGEGIVAEVVHREREDPLVARLPRGGDGHVEQRAGAVDVAAGEDDRTEVAQRVGDEPLLAGAPGDLQRLLGDGRRGGVVTLQQRQRGGGGQGSAAQGRNHQRPDGPIAASRPILRGMPDTHSIGSSTPARGLIVALDGPAASGKSSVGAAAARELGYRFCDTGLLYRAVTWLALDRQVPTDDTERLVALVYEIELLDVGDGRLAHVAVDGVDRTAEVKGPEVDVAVSGYSGIGELRGALLARQRSLAADGRIIMAGRDIGTVVLPDAGQKLYLDASVEERAERRAAERGFKPGSPEAVEILADLRRRDELDSTRIVAPLRAAEDAVVVRTDGNTFEQTVALVVGEIRKAEAALAAAATASPSEPSGRRPATDTNRTPRAPRRLVRPTPIATRLGFAIRYGSVVLRFIARAIARLRIEGDLATLPKEGALIVAANHASSADPVLIGAFLNPVLGRPLNWLGKRELTEWWLTGWAFRRAGIHGIDRDAADLEAFRTAMRILDAGQVLAVFPEGTRSRDGALQRAREGVGVLALRSGAQVLPVAVIDSDILWPKGRLLPRFGKHVTVRYGAPFSLVDELTALGQPLKGREATEAATRIVMTRIAALLPPRQRGVYAAEADANEA
ncbi:MAG TPA: (d)CMP kinase [Candidatus Limnocylindria bacterium]|nr:(d)CMP kinase [Candidatus Limnocylindria bacterium]